MDLHPLPAGESVHSAAVQVCEVDEISSEDIPCVTLPASTFHLGTGWSDKATNPANAAPVKIQAGLFPTSNRLLRFVTYCCQTVR